MRKNDRLTSRHAGYAISQCQRKPVEQIFGWIKTVGGLRKTRHRGTRRVGWMFTLALAAYNLRQLAEPAQRDHSHTRPRDIRVCDDPLRFDSYQ